MLVAFEKYKRSIEGKDVTSSIVSQNIDKEIPKETVQEATQTKQNPQNTAFADKVIQSAQKNSGLTFRVQILSLNARISEDSPRLKGEENTYQYKQGGLFKYCTKGFGEDVKSAVKYKVQMREKGFKGAFVVAFLDGERIGIEKAIKLVEK